LLRIAALTGGGPASSNPADAFAHTLKATGASTPLWPWLLLLAAILLPLDVASRRLILTRHDWARFLESLQRLRRKPEKVVVEQSPSMSALLQARDRARDGVQAAPEKKVSEQPVILENLPIEPEPPEKNAEPPATPQEPASTTASLLARKRNLRGKRE
jgi:hypothetical protein